MRKFIKTAYFDFLKDKKIKRLAYAASFGTDEWEYTPNLEQECAELIKKFDAVSVRETSGIKMCKEHFNMDAQLVLDPTLLLKTEDYVDLQENTDAGSENLFCYILDKTDDKQALIDSVSQHLSLNPVYMGLNTEGQSIKQRVFEPVEIWLTNFQKSKFVITDSFHGMIFSIIYNKPFIVYGNKRRGISRFESILNVLNLQNRLVFTSTIDEALTTKNNINWEMVNNKISELRQESVDFLYKYLR
jgi:exopolysaccharide biosynthesis predicted pyruvyltransferase EpsI